MFVVCPDFKILWLVEAPPIGNHRRQHFCTAQHSTQPGWQAAGSRISSLLNCAFLSNVIAAYYFQPKPTRKFHQVLHFSSPGPGNWEESKIEILNTALRSGPMNMTRQVIATLGLNLGILAQLKSLQEFNLQVQLRSGIIFLHLICRRRVCLEFFPRFSQRRCRTGLVLCTYTYSVQLHGQVGWNDTNVKFCRPCSDFCFVTFLQRKP